MSPIHITELCGGNPFDYVTELQRNTEAVAAAPDKWMPWNYLEALGRVNPAPGRGS